MKRGGARGLSARATEAAETASSGPSSLLARATKGETTEWVNLEYGHPNPSDEDWIGVFSPAKFSTSVCEPESGRDQPPLLCTSPIKVLKNEASSAGDLGVSIQKSFFRMGEMMRGAERMEGVCCIGR
ncbi:uncharacterized protein A4U43_C10F1400 [Asparagus officinalis]|uniref:Purple acid phosphatase Fn3-like domain-containing protein n=1 Tax=Asparagus officinalis TaxID=4686 RepID=A0A5P1E0A7_ASPOF|nr:uncharacterized protein A4U43_C10F1400 [Asparagus officinalis]